MWITGSIRRAQDWEIGVTYNPEYEEYQLALKTKFDNMKIGMTEEQLQEILAKGTAALGNPRKKKESSDEPPF